MVLSGRARGCLLAAMILGCLATASPAAAVEPAEFCAEQVVHDYLKPLKQLPKLKPPPVETSFAFGPRNLRVATLDPLLVEGGRVGYSLYIERDTGASVVHPGWRVTTELSRVNRAGDEVERIKVWRRTIGVLSDRNAAGLDFELGEEPGLFRLLVTIQNKGGKTLGGFGYYARVVAATNNARLAITPGPYRPGGTVSARIENLGTASAYFGAPWSLERFNGSTWEKAPEGPRGPWILPLYSANAGMTSNGCVATVSIAPTMFGLYRVVKEVTFDRFRTATNLTAEFEVTR